MKFARWYSSSRAFTALPCWRRNISWNAKVGEDHPAGLTHPEYFYGFLGVAIAWQIAFFVIAHDPRRFGR